MKWLIFIILSACATPAKQKITSFSCPNAEVCLLNQDNQLVAVNSSDKTVAIQLSLNHIQNVELKYRYPFVEFLGPNTSKVLLTYRFKKKDRGFAFDYAWNWRMTE